MFLRLPLLTLTLLSAQQVLAYNAQCSTLRSGAGVYDATGKTVTKQFFGPSSIGTTLYADCHKRGVGYRVRDMDSTAFVIDTDVQGYVRWWKCTVPGALPECSS